MMNVFKSTNKNAALLYSVAGHINASAIMQFAKRQNRHVFHWINCTRNSRQCYTRVTNRVQKSVRGLLASTRYSNWRNRPNIAHTVKAYWQITVNSVTQYTQQPTYHARLL